ncbi:7tm 2 domain containing protein [Asbolus verrucosus]|uniref:7tm 2 domain containing protein n=1 Tax=Asbolus verrucosus TaxID=1661398 RepID=A0A482W2V3_ASBVE|nr:7tm 2 domain containing protein [Asbolus verrucosus]
MLSTNSTTALLETTLNIVNGGTFKKEVKPVDILFISKILERGSEDDDIYKHSNNFNEIISSIMEVEKDILESSQRLLNSTDRILHNLEKLLLNTEESKFISSSFLFVYAVNTSEEPIGAMILKNENFTSLEVVSLHTDNYVYQLENTDFEIAFHIPFAFTKHTDQYFVVLFRNDNLFNQEKTENDFRIGSWIINILIPGVTTNDTSTIQIYFKESKPHLYQNCNSWRYGNKSRPIKGHWNFDNEAAKFKDETSANAWAIPNEFCLQANYSFVLRYCFNNGFWGEVQGECSREVSVTNITNALYGMLNANSTVALNTMLNVINSEEFKQELKPIDIDLISKILVEATEDIYNSHQLKIFTEIVNNVMNINKNTLQSSQLLLSSTDRILYSLDQLILKKPEPKFVSLSSLLIDTINTSEGAVGAMIRNNEVIYLYNDNYANQLENTDFEVAFQVPLSFARYTDHYFIVLFRNDNLFNQEGIEIDFNIGSWIIKILNPDITTNVTSTIRIYFKESSPHLYQQCNYWRYDNNNTKPIKGHWSFEHTATKFKDETPANTWATPIQLCLQANYSSVLRYCSKDGFWGEVQGECSHEVTVTNTTNTLHKMLEENSTIALNTTLEIINNETVKELKPIDIDFISKILVQFAENDNASNQLNNFGKIVNSVMETDKDILESSQQLLNSTDRILYSLDQLLLKTTEPKFASLPLLVIYTVNTTQGAIGAIIKTDEYSSLRVIFLYNDSYALQLESEDFEIAFVVPPSLTKNCENYFITLLRNDNLFNQEKPVTNLSDASSIINILIPNVVVDNSSTIKFYFKKSELHPRQQCSYWSYGNNQDNIPTKGHWSFENDAKTFRNNCYLCETLYPRYFRILGTDKPHTCPEEFIEHLKHLFRRCFQNESWGEVQGECANNNYTNTTLALHEILGTTDPSTALNLTINVVKSETFKEALEPIGVHFISQILENAIENENTSIEDVSEIINNVMEADKSILKSSQLLLNSTDRILYNLDKLLLNTKKPKNVKLPFLLVHTVNTTDGKVTGGIIKTHGKGNKFSSFEVLPLHNETELDNGTFELAFIVPPSFTQGQKHYFISLFYNDHFFNEDTNRTDSRVGSWIISILIPGAPVKDTSTIQIYFKEGTSTLRRQCSYWHYGYDEERPIKGHWNSDNNATYFRNNFYVCKTNHTTQFSLLVYGSVLNDFFSDLITILGSILAPIALFIIAITACTFRTWKNDPNNKIIVNIALCFTILVVILWISDQTDEGPYCIAVGILLHYIVLVQFFWMLIISYSSYRRLVLSLHYHVTNVVLKYCLFCWGTPVIIVIIVAVLNVQTYDKKSEDTKSFEICYPKGIYFNYAVFLPVGIILLINSMVCT